jgi:hypothetical protein
METLLTDNGETQDMLDIDIDEDIDFMQKVIENICPSCGKLGRSRLDHDRHVDEVDSVDCIRYFMRLCSTTRIEYNDGILKSFDDSNQDHHVMLCSPEDLSIVQNWLLDNSIPGNCRLDGPEIEWN